MASPAGNSATAKPNGNYEFKGAKLPKNVQTSPIKTYSEGYRKLNEQKMHEQPVGTQALGSNRRISADNGSPASSSGPTQFPTNSSSNEKTEGSKEVTAFQAFVGFSAIILFFASVLLTTGWTYYHYGYFWCLIPVLLASFWLEAISNGDVKFRFCVPFIWVMPNLALSCFTILFSLPNTACVDEQQFYGEWVHYSDDYRDKDWQARTQTTIEIMPKWADRVTDKKRQMVRTRLTEIKLNVHPYISKIKLKNYFDWHIEGDEIVFVSNDVYTTENGTPYMDKSEGEGSARITYNFDKKDGIVHYTESNGVEKDLRRGANPYSSKKSKAGWLW
jgi:hypothetical protein